MLHAPTCKGQPVENGIRFPPPFLIRLSTFPAESNGMTYSIVEHLDIAFPLRHFCPVRVEKDREVSKLWCEKTQRRIEIKVQWEGRKPLLAEEKT